ncbi:MAG: tetratricopeptide repeat protein [Lentisphaerae bacterium]|nr:tetratricopeptide repeat protein [Lentisphaerota bacterium]
MNRCWTSSFLAIAPVLMLLLGGCRTASQTELKQGVVLDEQRPVVLLSAKEVLSQQELDEATAWAEYAKGSGLLIEEQPDFDQAAKHLTKALSLVPDSHPIATALVGPRLAGKEMEKAVADLKVVAAANPTAPIPNLLYAECLAMLKRQDEAIEHLLKTVDVTDWQEPQVVQTTALMLSRDKDPKRTEKFFRQAFAHRHLRDNHVLQTIAASFWLDVADFRQATIEQKLNGNRKNTENDKAAKNGTGDKPAEGDKGDKPAEGDKESENFALAFASYNPDDCRARARAHAARAVALPGIPSNSVWETGPDGLELLGGILLRLEEWELLDQLLGKLDAKPEHRDSNQWKLMKIALLEKRGDNEKLIDYLDSLNQQQVDLKHYQEEFVLRQAIAEQYIKAESYDKAIQALETVVTYYPRDYTARLRLAQLYLFIGRANSGLATLAPLKNLPPYGWLLSARLWRAAGNFDRALKSLETAEKVARELKDEDFFTASFHTSYALICESAGKIDQAIAQSRLAHAKNPDDPSLCNFLGYVLADHNRDLPEAEKLIEKAIAAEPENTAYLDSLAWVYYRQQRFPEALDAIVKSIRLGGIEQDPEGVIADHAGDIFAANGFLRIARHYWLIATTINDATAAKINAKLNSAAAPQD